MAKYNLFLGTASGSVGDVTMYVSGGTQVSRVRRRVIANPRSYSQCAQRVIIKTCAAAYSVMQPLVSQSFPRCSGRAANQSRFLRLNARWLRQYLEAAEGGHGLTPENIPNNDLGNIMHAADTLPTINNYIISEGPLSFMGISALGGTYPVFPVSLGDYSLDSITWSQFASLVGARIGDQLTFVFCFADSDDKCFFTDFQVARIVLMPNSGDPSQHMFVSFPQPRTDYTINDPSPSNDGDVRFVLMSYNNVPYIALEWMNGHDLLLVPGRQTSYYPLAMGAILSRRVGRGWAYSTCQLRGGNTDRWPLNDAVASYMGDMTSSRYLDQAQIV